MFEVALKTGCVEVPAKFQPSRFSVAKWSHGSLDSPVPIMTEMSGKVCKSFEREDDLFSLMEKVCIK